MCDIEDVSVMIEDGWNDMEKKIEESKTIIEKQSR